MISKANAQSSNSFLIGVGGGTASGKTTFVRELQNQSPSGLLTVIPFDWYYRGNPNLSMDERNKLNFDHPSRIEIDLLVKHLISLKAGQSIEAPQYDFSTHDRMDRKIAVAPAKVIVVEGILALTYPELRSLFDFTIFVYSPDDLRLKRRLIRDVRERGRTEASVLEQWETTVYPMHKDFCAPAMQEADLVISGNDEGLMIIPAVLKRAGIL